MHDVFHRSNWLINHTLTRVTIGRLGSPRIETGGGAYGPGSIEIPVRLAPGALVHSVDSVYHMKAARQLGGSTAEWLRPQTGSREPKFKF